MRLAILLAMVLVGTAMSQGVGDRLLRTFKVFSSLPMTVDEAEAAGWTSESSSCNNGYVYAPSGGIVASNSIFLVFSAAGQVSGFGVRVFGDSSMSSQLSPEYWKMTGNNQFDLTVYTRELATLCGSDAQPEPLGDRVLVAGTLNVPLTMGEAESAGWYQGNCIPEMGIHHSFDLNAPGNMSWNASSLIPIMPMYDAVNQSINAVLFNIPDWQHTEPLGDWEGPLLPFLFCKNWCSTSGCQFPGVTTFSTMHWLFVDPSSISCSGAACVIMEGDDDGMDMAM